jgi:hypothetical protein
MRVTRQLFCCDSAARRQLIQVADPCVNSRGRGTCSRAAHSEQTMPAGPDELAMQWKLDPKKCRVFDGAR